MFALFMDSSFALFINKCWKQSLIKVVFYLKLRLKCTSCYMAIEVINGKECCIETINQYAYIYIHTCKVLLWHALPAITIMTLWQLVHFDTPMYEKWVHPLFFHFQSCMSVPKCTSCNKLVMVVTRRVCCIKTIHICYAHSGFICKTM